MFFNILKIKTFIKRVFIFIEIGVDCQRFKSKFSNVTHPTESDITDDFQRSLVKAVIRFNFPIFLGNIKPICLECIGVFKIPP